MQKSGNEKYAKAFSCYQIGGMLKDTAICILYFEEHILSTGISKINFDISQFNHLLIFHGLSLNIFYFDRSRNPQTISGMKCEYKPSFLCYEG
jgi:hypothetical protein